MFHYRPFARFALLALVCACGSPQVSRTVEEEPVEANDAAGDDLRALLVALEWGPGEEEQAAQAASEIAQLELPEDDKGPVVAALAESLRRVGDARPQSNRLRLMLLRALGSTRHEDAQAVLLEIASRQDPAQPFLINRLALTQLRDFADARAVDALIAALFRFGTESPAMRMNDVATNVLIQIGRPALEPLLSLLRGENEEANAIAASYIEAVRELDAATAEQMSVSQVVSGEATYALGALGLAEAHEPLLAQTRSEAPEQRLAAAIALVQVSRGVEARERAQEALAGVYGSVGEDDVPSQAQLIAASRHLATPSTMPFLSAQARREDLNPMVRGEAIRSLALLANRQEAQTLQSWLSSAELPLPFAEEAAEPIALAIECDEDLDCYRIKLGEDDSGVSRKAATMLGRLGQSSEVIDALVEHLGHPDMSTRIAVLTALEHVAVGGSPEAVEKIDEVLAREEGTAIGASFSRVAMPARMRLRRRILVE